MAGREKLLRRGKRGEQAACRSSRCFAKATGDRGRTVGRAGLGEGQAGAANAAGEVKQRRETGKSRLRDSVRKAAREQETAGVKSKQMKGFKTGWAWFK